MELFSGLNQPLKRYLILLYGITLGLALVLAAYTIAMSWKAAPAILQSSGTVVAPTDVPTQENSEVHTRVKPTQIPDIPPTPNQVTPSTLGVTSKDLKGERVTVWQPWSDETGAVLKKELDEYSQTNPWGISVDVQSYEGFGRMDEAVNTAIISGTLPDMIIDYGYQERQWDSSSTLVDLAPYVQDPLWGYSSGEQADFYPEFWSEDLVSAVGSDTMRRLGIPFYRSAYVIFYNQTWAKELGFSRPPQNPEDFLSQACESTIVSAAHNSGVQATQGGWLIRSIPGEVVSWIYAFGGAITNPDGQGYLFNTLETRQAFSYLKDLVEKGCARFDPGADPQVELARRGALFVVGSLFDIPAQEQAFYQAGSTDEWAIIPFPSRKQPVVDTYGPSIMITRSTPARQLAAWLVLKWLVYPRIQTDWVKTVGAYPTRQSSASTLAEDMTGDPHWNQALSLLPVASSEPSAASWGMVRWTLNDAMAALVDPKLTKGEIPALLEQLDSTATEIFRQVP